MDIEALKSILKDLRDIKERFETTVKKSDLSGMYIDEFGEKLNDLASVVGDAIGRETVSQIL